MLGSQYNYICIVFYEHFVHFCRNFTDLNILFVRKHGFRGRIKVTPIYIKLHCHPFSNDYWTDYIFLCITCILSLSGSKVC